MFIQTGSRLYTSSPSFSLADNDRKTEAWCNGSVIQSAAHAVGKVSVTGIQAILDSPDIKNISFRSLAENGKLWLPKELGDAVLQVRQTFLEVVNDDAKRNGLRGEPVVSVLGGTYASSDVRDDAWHHDGSRGVRWTVGWGNPGSTRTARGPVSLADSIPGWDFINPDIVGPGKQLKPDTYDLGTVIRFSRTGDIHAGPPTTGVRLFMRATIDY